MAHTLIKIEYNRLTTTTEKAMTQQPQSEQHNNVSALARPTHMFGAVRAMYVIGTADELLALRKRNEARLAIAKAQPKGRQVYRPE
jgi:hypothetical protein